MPSNDKEYQREYRLKNRDKLRSYERERSKRRRGSLTPSVITTTPTVSQPIPCMVPGCGLPHTIAITVDGINLRLCDKHEGAKLW